MSHKELIENGYREFSSGHLRYHRLYQKRIKSGNITRYFINVELWNCLSNNFYNLSLYLFLPTECKPNYLIVNTDVTQYSVSDVEKFCESMYERLGCVPDVDNQ